MSAVLRRGRHRGRRSLARAAGLAGVLSLAATLSAIAPNNDPATGAAPDAATPRNDRSVVAKADAAPEAPAAAAAPGAPAQGTPRPKVTTMSMDEPIQGGLTARQAQAASASVRQRHDDVATATAATTWTPAMGRTALARARSWLGLPYSWAGGSASGPTAGRCEPGNGADLDCRIVGFDCSGLMMYAWGPYAVLPHFAQTQREAGEFHPTVKQLRAGDMVFFSGYLPDGIGHVAIYEGDGMVIEAPQSGSVVRRSSLADLMAENGTYRGAVRPLTTAAPTLAGTTTALPRNGGEVTLRGSHLSGVTSLTVGTRTVRSIERRSDSALVFRVPRVAGSPTIAVTARTSWGASSKPVVLTYAKPVRATPPPAVLQPTAPKPAPSTPKPAPSTTAPTTPKPTTPKPSPSKPSSATPSPSPSTSAAKTSAPASSLASVVAEVLPG